MTNWVERHIGIVVAGIAVLTIILGAATVWLIKDDRDFAARLGPVQAAGPCRAAVAEEGLPAGLFDRECSQQSDYVIWSYCLRHNVRLCPALPKQLRPNRSLLEGGGSEPSAPEPSEQPGGLAPPPGEDEPRKPDEPPPPPPEPECTISALGVCIDLP